MTITRAEFEEAFDYNPDTGELTWRKSGKPAGYLDTDGYRRVNLRGKLCRSHRLIAAAYLGLDLSDASEVDHVNGQRDDNRLANLRLVSHRQNSQNQVCHRKGNLPGATFHKRANKWQAKVTFNNERIALGLFDSELEAHEAYMKAVHEIEKGSFIDRRPSRQEDATPGVSRNGRRWKARISIELLIYRFPISMVKATWSLNDEASTQQ